MLSGNEAEFWVPCDSVGPPIAGYGVQLIRLCLYSEKVSILIIGFLLVP